MEDNQNDFKNQMYGKSDREIQKENDSQKLKDEKAKQRVEQFNRTIEKHDPTGTMVITSGASSTFVNAVIKVIKGLYAGPFRFLTLIALMFVFFYAPLNIVCEQILKMNTPVVFSFELITHNLFGENPVLAFLTMFYRYFLAFFQIPSMMDEWLTVLCLVFSILPLETAVKGLFNRFFLKIYAVVNTAVVIYGLFTLNLQEIFFQQEHWYLFLNKSENTLFALAVLVSFVCWFALHKNPQILAHNEGSGLNPNGNRKVGWFGSLLGLDELRSPIGGDDDGR